MKYQRGEFSILPYEQIDPDTVARAVNIAKALVGMNQLIRASGYQQPTVVNVLNGRATTDRVRSDLLRCARAICQEQKQTFFDLAAVEPEQIPEAVFPIQTLRMIEMEVDFPRNVPNPYRYSTVQWNFWQMLYLSIRPANTPWIHFYGKPLEHMRGCYMQWPDEKDHAWIAQMINGPTGWINQKSVIVNPTILDKFAKELRLVWNIWGQALQIDVPDLMPRLVS